MNDQRKQTSIKYFAKIIYINFTQHVSLLFISAGLASCTFGTVIDRPSYADFPYGLKTPSDLFSRYGKTEPNESTAINGENITEYCYRSTSLFVNLQQGGSSSTCFRFTDKDLVGVIFTSSRAINVTKLAFEELSKISIGMTKSDVTMTLGQPHGVLRYPYLADRNQIAFLYRDFVDKNTAQVIFDEEEKVTAVHYDSHL